MGTKYLFFKYIPTCGKLDEEKRKHEKHLTLNLNLSLHFLHFHLPL